MVEDWKLEGERRIRLIKGLKVGMERCYENSERGNNLSISSKDERIFTDGYTSS